MRSIEDLQQEIRELSSSETLLKWLALFLVISTAAVSFDKKSVEMFLAGFIGAAIPGGMWLENVARRRRIEQEIKEREWG